MFKCNKPLVFTGSLEWKARFYQLAMTFLTKGSLKIQLKSTSGKHHNIMFTVNKINCLKESRVCCKKVIRFNYCKFMPIVYNN